MEKGTPNKECVTFSFSVLISVDIWKRYIIIKVRMDKKDIHVFINVS